MKTQNRSRGFTLIELLVVIAIIGILSAVVLASLNTARSKGNDAAIQSDLTTIHTQAEIFYGDHANSYSGVCSDTGVIANARAGINTANGAGTDACFDSATAYSISSPLSSDSSKHWCVDSTGASGQRSAAVTTTVCPAS